MVPNVLLMQLMNVPFQITLNNVYRHAPLMAYALDALMNILKMYVKTVDMLHQKRVT